MRSSALGNSDSVPFPECIITAFSSSSSLTSPASPTWQPPGLFCSFLPVDLRPICFCLFSLWWWWGLSSNVKPYRNQGSESLGYLPSQRATQRGKEDPISLAFLVWAPLMRSSSLSFATLNSCYLKPSVPITSFSGIVALEFHQMLSEVAFSFTGIVQTCRLPS